MGNKEIILEILKKEKKILASTEIRDIMIKNYGVDKPQAHIHYYIKNLGDLVEKVPLDRKVRFCCIGYKASDRAFAKDRMEYTFDQLVILMQKAGIKNTEKYGIHITEADLQESIERIRGAKSG